MAEGVPGRSRVRLKDVAERAGVSPTTASFVLSGRRDMRISTATEERVRQAARMLSFVPKAPSHATRPRRALGIGLLSFSVGTEAFAGQMIRGSVDAATEGGHFVLVAEAEGDRRLEEANAQDLVDCGIERFVYATNATRTCRIPAALKGRPLVLLNCFQRRGTAPAVIPDDRAAGRAAAAALLAAGHTDRIVLVGETPPESFPGVQRRAGVLDELAAAGHELFGHVSCIWWPSDVLHAMAGVLARPPRDRPTAVIALNDRAAMGVYQAAAAAGLQIPQQLSVISFDDSDLAGWLVPGLTSLALPHLEMGRRAVEMLLAGPSNGQRLQRMPMPLRERASIAAPHH
jgi:LacI family transcriptional regulator